MKQLSQALPAMCLKPFQNRYSNAINTPIPQIFTSLLSTYGRFPEDKLLTQENNLRKKVFNIVEPLVILFNKIKDLQELVVASCIPYSDPQSIASGKNLKKI